LGATGMAGEGLAHYAAGRRELFLVWGGKFGTRAGGRSK